ncbi:hypothetical protein [Candidatus Poriferisodalis sp.]|uniref:hypothetical protein n=1 Tax=Candidatus Poriferisodalis sp. TaxID=3101277 RepID=UPI003D0E82A3
MNALRPVPDRAVSELFEGDIPNPAQAGQSRAKAVNEEFKAQAHKWMQEAGASIVRSRHKVGAYEVEAEIVGLNGQRFLVLVHGVPDDGERAGLRRTDTVKKMGFDAIMIGRLQNQPVLVLTSHLPESGAAKEMLADCAANLLDVFATNGDFAGFQRLQRYLHDDLLPEPLPAPWRESPSQRTPELFDTVDQPHRPDVVGTPAGHSTDTADPP